ncbi:MAG TPA: hypothetical protein VFJ47_03525, partial [Terriglobales bacterium]|nr:hypothetical protein [Terriglobales bacterium]
PGPAALLTQSQSVSSLAPHILTTLHFRRLDQIRQVTEVLSTTYPIGIEWVRGSKARKNGEGKEENTWIPDYRLLTTKP